MSEQMCWELVVDHIRDLCDSLVILGVIGLICIIIVCIMAMVLSSALDQVKKR